MIIRPADLNGFECRKGARRWFAANGLSWQDFVTNGVEADILRATGDALALEVVARAEAKHGRSDQETDNRV